MKHYFEHYYRKYPQSTIQDYLKYLKQMCHGPNHFFRNEDEPIKRLIAEVENQKKGPSNEDLYEYVGSNYLRINLRPYQKLDLDLEKLNSAFVFSATIQKVSIDIDTALIKLENFLVRIFPEAEVKAEISKYKTDNYPALSHSKIYHQTYMPAYRLIQSKFIDNELRLLQIQNFLKRFPKKELTVIAIDGASSSGKTTLSNELKKREDITLIHVDDFFDESNEEVGINSARIKEEILLNLCPGKPLIYQKYDCTKKEFIEERIQKVKNIVVLEGVYSANPVLRDFLDAFIFFDISKEEQILRLEKRSKKLLPRFLSEWLPRERRYFQKENVYTNADLIV